MSGCGGAKAGACRSDDDCPGGACVVGMCRPLVGGDLSGAAGDLGPIADLATPIPDGWNPDALTATCSFNSDGTLQRSEEPFVVGLGALFAVNAPGTAVPVNNVPANNTWDFSAPVSSEAKQFDQLVSPTGQWWSSDFPDASYGERVDDGQQPYGVFKVSADKRGTTRTPAGSFDTLRLQMSYSQLYGALTTTRITYLHLAECYGAVARVRSKDNESSADFTQAAEYRRLANP